MLRNDIISSCLSMFTLTGAAGRLEEGAQGAQLSRKTLSRDCPHLPECVHRLSASKHWPNHLVPVA